MTDEEIFDLADQYGWMDDFGRWNFQPDRLVSFALAMSEKHGVFRTNDRHEFFCPRCGHCCREWVGLTDEEIKALSSWWPSYDQMPALMTLARDIENTLKEKNNVLR
jgi:hypothetical protein